jgi:hypothetical protein
MALSAGTRLGVYQGTAQTVERLFLLVAVRSRCLPGRDRARSKPEQSLGPRKGESVKILMIRILMMSVIAFCVCVSLPYAQSQSNARPAMASEADFRRAMKELSNWGRWGADDELGAANLIRICPDSCRKRKMA